MTSDLKLRGSLIRLAHARPELRTSLLPLLKTAGGTEFREYGVGTDPKKVFQKLVDEAENDVRSYREDDDEGGYSGTILEKASDGFVLRGGVMTLSEAKAFANRDLDHNEKFGPAFAIAVTSGQPSTKGKKVVLRADSEGDARRSFELWAKTQGGVSTKIKSVRDTGEKDKYGFGLWEVRGDLTISGPVVGYLFYGIASS